MYEKGKGQKKTKRDKKRQAMIRFGNAAGTKKSHHRFADEMRDSSNRFVPLICNGEEKKAIETMG